MAEIELFRCERLRAEISQRQCLINQDNGRKNPGSIYGTTCSDCELGRVLDATWEGARPEIKAKVERQKAKVERQKEEGVHMQVQGLKPAAALCKVCGERAAELDKNGRSTGKCIICQQEHMKKNVHRTGKSGLGREMNVYVSFADCPDLLTWLREEAKRQERTPAQQVRFLLRCAREAEVGR